MWTVVFILLAGSSERGIWWYAWHDRLWPSFVEKVRLGSISFSAFCYTGNIYIVICMCNMFNETIFLTCRIYKYIVQKGKEAQYFKMHNYNRLYLLQSLYHTWKKHMNTFHNSLCLTNILWILVLCLYKWVLIFTWIYVHTVCFCTQSVSGCHTEVICRDTVYVMWTEVQCRGWPEIRDLQEPSRLAFQAE